ncbi:hypothetical protein M9Y10_027844 [Tritrichomonas musculus]|uniref:Dipeptidyl aminopeptidase III n=1 Tax=Tritrichomonas musculus TaxID=1915356 RepID=A0ABR2H600_9EUKA
MSTTNPSYLCITGFNVQDLHVGKYIKTLSDKAKAYATYLSLASWAGFPILAAQTSRESPSIHEFLSAFITEYDNHDQLVKSLSEPGTTLYYLIEYAAQFYNSCANYLGMGDSKFIPRCSKEEIKTVLKGQKQHLTDLFDKCSDSMYSTAPSSLLQLGFNPEGTTAYYDPFDFTEDEQQKIDKILKEKGIRVENTIVIRNTNRNCYEVSVASIDIDQIGIEIGELNGLKVILTKGRHSEILKKVVHWLQLARENAENDTQKEMLLPLIEHYQTGSVLKHEEFSEKWVKDRSMTVEMHHGFIECYRDPAGVRCEYEGYVSVVDKEESECLHDYVRNSAKILSLMPYPKEYERTIFQPPSYDAINFITICTTSVPTGINLPNYDNIRLKVGFKNVSIPNVMGSKPKVISSYAFLKPEQAQLLLSCVAEVDNFKVASHELFGHGSAKIFKREDVVGKNVVDLLDPTRFVTTYYEEGVGFDESFGGIAQTYEECRADTTAIYLSFKKEALDIFKVPPEKQKDFTLCQILFMVNTAMKNLYFYSPETKKWSQPHSAARFAIFKALLNWGNDSVKLIKNDQNEYIVWVDPENLDGCYEAIKKLLIHLNYYKSTAQVERGKEFFLDLISVDEKWIQVRNYALTKKSRKGVFCQSVIRKTNDGKYEIGEVSNDPKTILDCAETIINNIKLALE